MLQVSPDKGQIVEFRETNKIESYGETAACRAIGFA